MQMQTKGGILFRGPLCINQFNLITAPATDWRWIFLGSRQFSLAITDCGVNTTLFAKCRPLKHLLSTR